MRDDNTDSADLVPESLLRGCFDSRPSLNAGFDDSVLQAGLEKPGKFAGIGSWRGWIMYIWWSLSAVLVCYGLVDLAMVDGGGLSLPVLIVLAILFVCGGLIVALLRFCGVRLSDTLLSTLEVS